MSNIEKVLFITNIPAPYTVDFFNELGKKVELTVLYEGKTTDERNDAWYSEAAVNFVSVFLNEQSEKRISVKDYINKGYDIIIVGNYASRIGRTSIRYMKRKKIPFYIHVDGGIINNDNLLKLIVKRWLLGSARGFFSSGEQTDKYIKHYCPKADILTYPFTSVRKAAFCSESLTHSQKLNKRNREKYKEEFVALFVGQFVHRKGLDILIDAAKSINENIGVYCLGGDPSPEITNRIESARVENVHFWGFVTPNDVLKELRLADFLVFPTRYDIWGLVINEALSQGTPVISTDMSVAALELIDNKRNGLIVKSEDSAALATAMNEITCDVESLDKMSANSASSVIDYTIENMADVYYKNILTFIERNKKVR